MRRVEASRPGRLAVVHCSEDFERGTGVDALSASWAAATARCASHSKHQRRSPSTSSQRTQTRHLREVPPPSPSRTHTSPYAGVNVATVYCRTPHAPLPFGRNMRASEAGSGSHGVIQIHNTDWLTDDDSTDADIPQPSPSSHSLPPSSHLSPTPAAAPSPPRRVPPRPTPQPFQPRTKKPTSYTDRYAALAPPPLPPSSPIPPSPTEERKESLAPPFSPSFPPALHSDILRRRSLHPPPPLR